MDNLNFEQLKADVHRTLIATAMLALASAAMPALADTDSTVTVTKTTTGKHHYVYYGDHQIYFAPETKTYYWQHDGSWTSGTELPTESRTYVTSGGTEIDIDTDHPYERNEWVVKHYKDKHDDSGKRERDER